MELKWEAVVRTAKKTGWAKDKLDSGPVEQRITNCSFFIIAVGSIGLG
jgi:hypothetical protein